MKIVNDEPDDARAAMDRLNDASRIFMEARLLAKSKPLTPEQIADTQRRFREYIEKHGVTTTQVARECGYSFSVVACFHAGNYTGNNDAVAHAVNDWMERPRPPRRRIASERHGQDLGGRRHADGGAAGRQARNDGGNHRPRLRGQDASPQASHGRAARSLRLLRSEPHPARVSEAARAQPGAPLGAWLEGVCAAMDHRIAGRHAADRLSGRGAPARQVDFVRPLDSRSGPRADHHGGHG